MLLRLLLILDSQVGGGCSLLVNRSVIVEKDVCLHSVAAAAAVMLFFFSFLILASYYYVRFYMRSISNGSIILSCPSVDEYIYTLLYRLTLVC